MDSFGCDVPSAVTLVLTSIEYSTKRWKTMNFHPHCCRDKHFLFILNRSTFTRIQTRLTNVSMIKGIDRALTCPTSSFEDSTLTERRNERHGEEWDRRSTIDSSLQGFKNEILISIIGLERNVQTRTSSHGLFSDLLFTLNRCSMKKFPRCPTIEIELSLHRSGGRM